MKHLFLLFLTGISVASAQQTDSIRYWLEHKELSQAEKACLDLVRTQNGNADAHCLLGDIYVAMSSNGAAIGCYDKAIMLKPSYGDAYAKRGYCHYMLKDLNSARLDLINASYYDRSAINYFNLGKVEQQMGKITEALKSYAQALKKDSNLKEVYRYRSEIYMEQHKYQLAMRDIDSSLKLTPFDDVLFVQRGTALLGLKKPREALQMFDRAIRLRSGSAAAHYGRARARFDMRQYEKALADLDTTVSYDKSFQLAYFNRALCRLEISPRNVEPACEDFKKAASFGNTESLTYIRKYCE